MSPSERPASETDAGTSDAVDVGAIDRALRDALSLAFPVSCSGCGVDGETVCAACARLFERPPTDRHLAGIAVVSAAVYADEVARVIGAFKDSGRRDARRVLGRALRGAVDRALATDADGSAVLAVPVPSSRSAHLRRGYDPVVVAARAGRIPIHPLLRLTRRVADQSGLGAADRRENRAGSLCARRPLAGQRILLLDDVVTTGATLEDACRAVREAGGTPVAAATIASTPLFRRAS